MAELQAVEFFGGPLDGQRRSLHDPPLVLSMPVPVEWTDDPVTNPFRDVLKSSMLYALRCVAGELLARDPCWQYEFRGYM